MIFDEIKYLIIDIYVKVHALIRVQKPDDLDAMSLDLPIMKRIGNQVKIECKSVRPYKEFSEDLKKRL